MGTKLIVDNTHQYSDLDELIVNHVQAMARKVEELMAHEKFKHGSEDELRTCPSSYTSFTRLTQHHVQRSLPQKLRCCKSSEEFLRFHVKSKATRTLQLMFLGEQEFNRSKLG